MCVYYHLVLASNHTTSETLSIVAYKQPLTRSEIESIRGVDCGGVIKTLMERNFIKVNGRSKSPGRPLLFGVTKRFLESFGLNKITDLPKLKELSELMSIIGLELGEPADDLNYGQIGILADADFDGFSIAALLVNFFSNWKELFEEERILLIKSPIVIAKKGNSIKRFYDLKDFAKESLDSSWRIEYNKGLGSLSVDEYDLMINDPVTEILKYDGGADSSLETAFGKNPIPRKQWLMI